MSKPVNSSRMSMLRTCLVWVAQIVTNSKPWELPIVDNYKRSHWHFCNVNLGPNWADHFTIIAVASTIESSILNKNENPFSAEVNYGIRFNDNEDMERFVGQL